MTDKNLGPTIIELQQYIQSILKYYLQDGKTYSNVTENEAINNLQGVKLRLASLCKIHEDYLDENELKYFNSHREKKTYRIPQFYGMPKVHKEDEPVLPFRPVISQCGSITAAISFFLDY